MQWSGNRSFSWDRVGSGAVPGDRDKKFREFKFYYFFWLGYLQYRVSFCCTVSAVQWSESAIWVHITPPSWTSLHPNPPGHHRTLSWAPCAVENLPTSYLFHTQQCMHVDPNLSVHPVPLFLTPSLCPHVCSLCLHLYFCSSNRFTVPSF